MFDQAILLQLAIRSLGITNLGIRIDREREVIVAKYQQADNDHTKEITFADIEGLFTEDPKQGRTASPGGNQALSG